MSTSTTPPDEARAPAPEIPLLGRVPERSDEETPVLAGRVNPEAAKEFRRIADLILHSRRVQGGMIGVLGDVPPAERAAVAAGLAGAMTGSGSVILVDADIESACLVVDDREDPQEGFVDVLRFGVRSPRIMAATGTAGLRLLGVGSSTVDVAGTLRAEPMTGLFQALQSGADFVVINGPGPLTPGADGLLPRLDCWVLVRGEASSGNAWIELSGLSRDRCLGRIELAPQDAIPREASPVDSEALGAPIAAPRRDETTVGDAYDALLTDSASPGKGRRMAVIAAAVVLVAAGGFFGWRMMKGASGTPQTLPEAVPVASPLVNLEREASIEAGAEGIAGSEPGTDDLATGPAAPAETANDAGTRSPEPATTSTAALRAKTPVAPKAAAGSSSSPAEASGQRYVVHVSSLKAEAGANEEAAELQAAGYLTVVRQEAVPGRGLWYRVYLGPYVGREVAQRIAGDVKSSGLRDYAQVMRWRKAAEPTPQASEPNEKPADSAATQERRAAAPTVRETKTSAPAAAEPKAADPQAAEAQAAEAQAAEPSAPEPEPAARVAATAVGETAETTPAATDVPAVTGENAAGSEGPPELPAWIAEVEGSTEISDLGVLEAFPNSSLGRTILYARFTDARTEDVSVTVHDVQGRELAKIDGKLRDGAAMFVWDGSTYYGSGPRSGVYFARLQASGTILSTKFEIP